MAKVAHIEVVIDRNSKLIRVKKLIRSESSTIIPVTEFSASRTRDIAPHPLCEELSYCAQDLPNADSQKTESYIQQLSKWESSNFSHPKVSAIYAYLSQKRLYADLSEQEVFPFVSKDAKGTQIKIEDEKVFIRWKIETVGDPCSGTWEDSTLIQAWISFDRTNNLPNGICMISGDFSYIGKKHPRFLRDSSDGAKLISANDDDGYTFRGRFTDGKKDYGQQTCSIGFDLSQKAHSALRWLIQRQGYRSDTQAIVCWAIAGAAIPNWFADTMDLNGIEITSYETDLENLDIGELFANRLRKAIAGYYSHLGESDDIVVISLDSATTGRMAIIFYRELKGSEFLARIENWHASYAWPQTYSQEKKFIGAPAPRDIAECIFGRWDEKLEKTFIEPKLLKSCIERLLPCIIDGRSIPLDLISSACHHVSNRVGFKRNKNGIEEQWEKCLGIACALFKGSQPERKYEMTLESSRKTRDYLYGRLLAIAENIEGLALHLADEKRDTSAARLMQKFADRPYSTWRIIELSLTPYKSRLFSSRGGYLFNINTLLDEVICSFNADEFMQDTPLSGEFLLGYHCQRQSLKLSSEPSSETPSTPSAE
jgi:CRISPR-associated protein Csd1